jgi:hypothetical protein
MVPKYLYHYCRIEALGEIVDSENIRFSRLDILNDPLEGVVDGIEENVFRKLVYVSCWNDQEEETINLWGKYTNSESCGVRIKVKNPIFGSYSDKFYFDEYADFYVPSCKIEPKEVLLTYNGFGNTQKINYVYGPFKISYVERDKLSDHVLDDGYVLITELGLKKAKEWNYENEWRFKLMLRDKVPEKIDIRELDTDKKYIDVRFNIKNICEVLLSPNMTDVEENEVKRILQTKNIKVPVKKSILRIRPKKH